MSQFPSSISSERHATLQDDKWAKGAALDETLAPLVDKLVMLSGGIRAGIEHELAAVRERRLAAIEADEGKGFTWYTFNYMLAARAVLDAFRNEHDAALAPAIERLQRGFDDGTAYEAAHAAETEVKPGRPLPGWVFVRASAGNYLRDAKEMRRALDPASKTGDSVLRTKFESLVNSYNSAGRRLQPPQRPLRSEFLALAIDPTITRLRAAAALIGLPKWRCHG